MTRGLMKYRRENSRSPAISKAMVASVGMAGRNENKAIATGTRSMIIEVIESGMATPENACRNGMASVYRASSRCRRAGSRRHSPLRNTCRKPWFQRVLCLNSDRRVSGVSSRVTTSGS